MKVIAISALAAAVLTIQANYIVYAQKENWRVYSPPDNSFSIELPAPLREVMSFEGEHGANLEPNQKTEGGTRYAAIETTPEESRFGIIVVHERTRAKFLRSLKRDELLDYLSAVLIGDDDETQFMKAPVEVKYNGLTGREYFYVKDITINDPLFTRGRIFDTGKKMFILIFVGRDTKDLTSPDAERFLNSFRLRKRRG
jgi:hypothetical protein